MSEDNCQTFKIECGIDKYFSEEIFVSKVAFSTDATSPDKSSYTKKCIVAPLQMKFSDYLASMFDPFTKNFTPEVVLNILEGTNFNIQKEALEAYSEKLNDSDNLDITRSLTSEQQIDFYKQCYKVSKNLIFEKIALTKNQFLETVKNRKPCHVMYVANSVLFRIDVLDITLDVRIIVKLIMCPENISLLPSSNIIRFVPRRPQKALKYVKAIYVCNDHSGQCNGSQKCHSDSDSDSKSESDSDCETEITGHNHGSSI